MITNIQMLRFLAALEVLLLHAFADFGDLGYHTAFTEWFAAIGGSGVDLFFVISGFVIQRSSEARPRAFSAFIIARLTRLVPIYWLATALMTVLVFWLAKYGSNGNAGPEALPHILTSLTFTSQMLTGGHPIVSPGWSLEFEVLFYLLFGLCLLMPLKLRFLSLAVLLASFAASTGNYFVLEFILGIGLSRLTVLKKYGNRNLLLTLLGGSLLVLSNFWPACDNFIKWGIPSALVVLGLVYSKQLVGDVWLYLGRVSYPLYIFHVLTISLFKWPFLHSRIDSFLVSVAVSIYVLASISVAVIVDRWFDKPIQRYLGQLLKSQKAA